MKFRNSLFAFAFFVAIGAAFAFKPAETGSGAGTVLHWYDPSNTSYMGANTTPDEEAASGCDQVRDLCENGYTSSQLINPAVPSQGVKPGEVPADQIFIEE